MFGFWSGASANAMPISVNRGSMMFSQWPGLSSQLFTTASAVSWPDATFPPTPRPAHAARALRPHASPRVAGAGAVVRRFAAVGARVAELAMLGHVASVLERDGVQCRRSGNGLRCGEMVSRVAVARGGARRIPELKHARGRDGRNQRRWLERARRGHGSV